MIPFQTCKQPCEQTCPKDIPWAVTVVSEIDCWSKSTLKTLNTSQRDIAALFPKQVLFPCNSAYWTYRTVIMKTYNWFPLFLLVPTSESLFDTMWAFLQQYPSCNLWVMSGGHSNLSPQQYTVGLVTRKLNKIQKRNKRVICGGGTLQGALYQVLLNSTTGVELLPPRFDAHTCYAAKLRPPILGGGQDGDQDGGGQNGGGGDQNGGGQDGSDQNGGDQNGQNAIGNAIGNDEMVHTTLLGNAATVGIAAVVMGGGVGALYRMIGLAMDNVLSFHLSTPAQGLLHCRPDSPVQIERDCFEAQLGSAGANFGILTKLELALKKVPDVVLQFELAIESSESNECVALISALLQFGVDAPREVVLEISALRMQQDVRFRLYGSWYGAPQGVDVLEQPWFQVYRLAAPSATYSQYWQTYAESSVEQAIYKYYPLRFTKTWFLWSADQIPPSSETEDAAQHCYDQIMEPVLISGTIRRAITLRCMGGAILDSPRYFAARRARIFGIFSIAFDLERYSNVQYTWLNETWSPLSVYGLQAPGTGVPLSYANFPFPVPDWQSMFYGDASRVAFLQYVKSQTDPDHLLETEIGVL